MIIYEVICMTIDLKSFVKSHFTVIDDNTSVESDLEKVHDGKWELARKSEYKRDVFSIPGEDVFVEVCFSRSGTYHIGYTYTKPKFSIVQKTTEHVISYPAILTLRSQAETLKDTYFDCYDETKLQPVYESGWVCEEKVNVYEKVYNIDGVLFKQTLYGNSDWTEFVTYDIVSKVEDTVTAYTNK